MAEIKLSYDTDNKPVAGEVKEGGIGTALGLAVRAPMAAFSDDATATEAYTAPEVGKAVLIAAGVVGLAAENFGHRRQAAGKKPLIGGHIDTTHVVRQGKVSTLDQYLGKDVVATF